MIVSGTSWLTDGAAGYVDSMQVMYNWSQAHFFRMGQQGREARSLITCVLFPQPMLPFIKLALEEGKEKLMLTQNSFEATNCARMMVGATCHKSVKSAQSETDLIGSEAIFKDLKTFGRGATNSPAQLLRMRAQHPNILVPESSWNAQVELIRAQAGLLDRY